MCIRDRYNCPANHSTTVGFCSDAKPRKDKRLLKVSKHVATEFHFLRRCLRKMKLNQKFNVYWMSTRQFWTIAQSCLHQHYWRTFSAPKKRLKHWLKFFSRNQKCKICERFTSTVFQKFLSWKIYWYSRIRLYRLRLYRHFAYIGVSILSRQKSYLLCISVFGYFGFAYIGTSFLSALFSCP